jgi:hypothetical protein
MNRLMQDVTYALRQLRKAPGFTLTAVLTLALGIGANAAIFTLVHAVLLQNLPVSDPSTLVRVGDKGDCCVNGGTPDNDDYSLFAYDLYLHLKDNSPEFENLAAMQAGLGYNTVTARSSAADSLPHASQGEYVSGNYFQTLGLKPYAGRLMGPSDDAVGAPAVAVVNQAFLKRFFPKGENPIGAHFGSSGVKSAGDYEIVGVASDVKFVDPREDVRPMYFRPLLQVAHTEPQDDIRSLYAGAIMLQMKGPVENLESQVRRTLANINPNLTVVNFSTFEGQIDGQFSQDRMIARLTLMFGVLALVLASVGLYGVSAYMVAGRTSEIGLRMALGADRRSVVAMVLRESLFQAVVGLVVGVPIALLCVRFLKTQLYGTSGQDLGVLAASAAVLTVAACAAGLIPARRAASIDPVKALRTE